MPLSEKKQEAIWRAAQELQLFTSDDIVAKTGAFAPAVSQHLDELVAEKKLFRSGRGWDRTYSLTLGKPRARSIVVPPTPDGMWKAIRHLKTFILADLTACCRMAESPMRGYLRTLVKGKYLTTQRLRQGVLQYTLAKDTGIHRPALQKDGSAAPPTPHERMWRAIKPLQVFGARELAMAAETTAKKAETYCRQLHRAGYLVEIYPKARRQGGFPDPAYRFNRSKDTGPRPPVMRHQQMFDQNLGAFVAPGKGAA